MTKQQNELEDMVHDLLQKSGYPLSYGEILAEFKDTKTTVDDLQAVAENSPYLRSVNSTGPTPIYGIALEEQKGSRLPSHAHAVDQAIKNAKKGLTVDEISELLTQRSLRSRSVETVRSILHSGGFPIRNGKVHKRSRRNTPKRKFRQTSNPNQITIDQVVDGRVEEHMPHTTSSSKSDNMDLSGWFLQMGTSLAELYGDNSVFEQIRRAATEQEKKMAQWASGVTDPADFITLASEASVVLSRLQGVLKTLQEQLPVSQSSKPRPVAVVSKKKTTLSPKGRKSSERKYEYGSSQDAALAVFHNGPSGKVFKVGEVHRKVGKKMTAAALRSTLARATEAGLLTRHGRGQYSLVTKA